MLLFPNVSKLSKFPPMFSVGCVWCGCCSSCRRACSSNEVTAAGCTRPLHTAVNSCSWGGEPTAAAAAGEGGGSLLQQLLGPGASAPTAASHQPTGENIILIHTMMGQSLIHNQKFPSHGNICFNDNIELKHYFIEISLPYPNSSRLWKIYWLKSAIKYIFQKPCIELPNIQLNISTGRQSEWCHLKWHGTVTPWLAPPPAALQHQTPDTAALQHCIDHVPNMRLLSSVCWMWGGDQTDRPLIPLRWRPNFTSTYRGLTPV